MYKSRFLRGMMQGRVLKYLKKTNMQPETLVIFRIAFAIIAATILFSGDYLLSAIFITLYQFVALLDYVDGSLARYRKKFSFKWKKIDMSFHYIISSLFLLGLTVSYFIKNYNLILFEIGILGVTATIASLLMESAWFEERNVKLGRKSKKRTELYGHKGFYTKIYSFLNIDAPFSLFFFFVILNLIPVAIVFFGLLKILIFIRKILLFKKWHLKTKKK